jgi:hypothetical protein
MTTSVPASPTTTFRSEVFGEMAWLRIDDRVRTHPKIVAAGPDAAWFWFCGICYCREHLTDGFIPKGMIASLVPGVQLPAAKRHTATLLRVVDGQRNPLWHDTEGGYRVHDFLDWNPSRAVVLAKRAEDLARKKKSNSSFQLESDMDSTAESGMDSKPIPKGIHKDSNATRDARARAPAGLGSGLGSGSGSSVLEESEKPFARRGRVPSVAGPSPMDWSRKHESVHVTEFCDFVCLPNDLLDSFARKVTGVPVEAARDQVLAWAQDIRRQWQGRIVPDGSDFDFWRNRWTETHGGSKPAAYAKTTVLGGMAAAVKLDDD